jgi:hypothetical protein
MRDHQIEQHPRFHVVRISEVKFVLLTASMHGQMCSRNFMRGFPRNILNHEYDPRSSHSSRHDAVRFH